MKVCKKCKKKVANKRKICNYCGADVSKCKIIKDSSQKNKDTEIKNIKEEIKIDVNQEKLETDKKEKKIKTILKKPKKSKIEKAFTVRKISPEKLKKINDKQILKKAKKTAKTIAVGTDKVIKSSNKKVKDASKNIKQKANEKIKENTKNIKNNINEKTKKTKEELKRKNEKNKAKRNVKAIDKKRLKEESNQRRKARQEIIGKAKEEKLKVRASKRKERQEESKHKKEKARALRNVKALDKSKRVKNKKDIKLKKILIPTTIVIILGLAVYGSIEIYQNVTNHDNAVTIGEDATNEKLFAMGDIITYKGVNYQVLKVETSEGNSYKAPKEGNEFLIITIQIENNTSDKVSYSYENWTMSNSTDDEEKRIFTSINVDTALYSGELVIGGIKRGSMVFEQPKNDKKLKLNFYELKEDKEGNEDIDKDKKIFSVSIKVPEEPKKVSKEEAEEKEEKSE